MKKIVGVFLFFIITVGALSGCNGDSVSKENENAKEDNKYQYEDGQYLVGTDIQAGEYKLVCKDNNTQGYYCVSQDALQNEKIAELSFENSVYVSVTDNQYLYLSGCYTTDELRQEISSDNESANENMEEQQPQEDVPMDYYDDSEESKVETLEFKHQPKKGAQNQAL